MIPHENTPRPCFCELAKKGIFIQLSDPYGHTSTRFNLLSGKPSAFLYDPLLPGMKSYDDGIIVSDLSCFDPQIEENKTSVFLIPDSKGDFSTITTKHIEETCDQLKRQNEGRNFYFLIPSHVELSYPVTRIANILHKELGISLVFINHKCLPAPGHEDCIDLSLKLPKNLLMGVQRVRLHLQSHPCLPQDMSLKVNHLPLSEPPCWGPTSCCPAFMIL